MALLSSRAETIANPSDTRAMWRLVDAVQQLSLAKSIEAIQAVVRTAARELVGSDGATFVLRDDDRCFYADEDAIAPLWKGQRFPLSACISGWVMLNRQPTAIEDIYLDPRIPADAYRPTFVKSLVMVPIRTETPVGAIGTYWASPHRASESEVQLLQALANTTSVAIENVQIYAALEQRVADRTRELKITNRELEAFSYTVSHDLRAPVRHIAGFASVLVEDFGALLPDEGKVHLGRIQAAADRMRQLIDDLLKLSRITQMRLARQVVDVAAMAQDILGQLRAVDPQRTVSCSVAAGLSANADAGLLRVVLDNLLSNAWKYTSKREHAQIEVGSVMQDGELAFFVRDNGAGFDMEYAEKLFAPFQRLHTEDEFPGSGVGLATTQRVIQRHGGRIWADARVGEGATFWFTLPAAGFSST